MAHSWNHDRASTHIEKALEAVSTVTIVEYVRDMSLESIPTSKAYRVDGVHLYADILNLDEMLGVTDTEGVMCHKRTLRFLNQHYRAASRILSRTAARRVDFHNQRLHALVTKPYNTEEGAEAARIHRAVAISQLIIDVLAQTGDDSDDIPNARVRVGIDSGETLAVNNGRSGNREPLFLGEAANRSAKLSGTKDGAEGIFLTNTARAAIGFAEVKDPAKTALTNEEIKTSQENAELEVTATEIVKEWRDDLDKNPIGSFEFSRHTPPFRTMDIHSLTPANSKRQEAISVYADIDGFTAYVKKHIEASPENVVRVFHVIRAELERVFTSEFDGRRIRFIGDCVHGLLCEGTAHTTDIKDSISSATLCAGGLRSSFDLSIEKLSENGIDVDGLGLAIGFEYGPMTVTRLGLQGNRVRCSVSRGVLASESEQMRCSGNETAIGEEAYKEASDAVKNLFGPKRKVCDLDYNEAVESLAEDDDSAGKAAKNLAYVSSPEMARAADLRINPHAR